MTHERGGVAVTEDFKRELGELLNRHSIESLCDTPDFLLAEMLCGLLIQVATTIRGRDAWYAFDPWKRLLDSGEF